MWTVRKAITRCGSWARSPRCRRGMVWQPDAVQEVLRHTQEVVPAWPAYGIGANPLTALRVYIEWRRLQKPPDHMPLRQALPPRCMRASPRSRRARPKDSKLEEMRPMPPRGSLLTRVFDTSGLALQNEVQQSVLRLARSQGVRVHQDKLKIDDPVKVLKDVEATPLSSEIACLDAVVTLLETDLGPMQTRARAWGGWETSTPWRRLPHADDRSACVAAVSTSERVRNLIARAQDDWLIAVQEVWRAIAARSPCNRWIGLLGENGALAALRAKGYLVEGLERAAFSSSARSSRRYQARRARQRRSAIAAHDPTGPEPVAERRWRPAAPRPQIPPGARQIRAFPGGSGPAQQNHAGDERAPASRPALWQLETLTPRVSRHRPQGRKYRRSSTNRLVLRRTQQAFRAGLRARPP